ncbi:MAG: helix-turn-helix domain-containing protein [Proteobacteria bacterium]|nr:helix-turn-helix domain-containing protein [Pseudomonadota bacterium]
METVMKLSYTPEGAGEETGMSRTRIFNALKTGDLKARKAGGRIIILGADLQAYIDALPERPAQAAA